MHVNKHCDIDNKNFKPAFKKLPPNVPRKYVRLPEWAGQAGRLAGEYAGMPEQKLFLAASAFLFQPFIDLKYAEDDKKSDAAVKSASKAIAGGITGIAIRALLQKFFNSKIGFSEFTDEKNNVLNAYLFPEKLKHIHKRNYIKCRMQEKKYCNTLSAMAAVLVMALITNEKIDVPLTGFFQDIFNGAVKEDKTWFNSVSNVVKAKYEKLEQHILMRFRSIKTAAVKLRRTAGIIKADYTIPAWKREDK